MNTTSLDRYRVVVAVCAHPDDEAFGLGAIITTLVEAGTEVKLICLTRGEGSTLGPSRNLAQRRLEELKHSADILGIGALAVHDHPDGGLAEIGAEELSRDIVTYAVNADALLTFDNGGITGHPDHQAATDAALVAGRRLAIPVLAWALPEPVARALRRQFGGGFSGRDQSEIDIEIAVDRNRQREAIRCHTSQSNPVPARRLELQGPVEAIRRLG